MSRTYKATGINLKGMSFGESDRLITILTPEYGLVRAVVPGARKHKSRLRGRSELFVVNELLIVKGRSLDKITQAETLESYPGLSKDLGKLAASQYMAELALYLGLSEQPQRELYELLNEHLRRLEKLVTSPNSPDYQFLILSHLAHSLFHFLALAGIGPQVQSCCITAEAITPEFSNLDWQAGFSIEGGGVVDLSCPNKPKIDSRLRSEEIFFLQQLPEPELKSYPFNESFNGIWSKIEALLRNYTQYHCGKPIRSADLIDTLFS
ncbi:MAG: DNA repair protein RecO [Spirulinaceae cyanobacterium]